MKKSILTVLALTCAAVCMSGCGKQGPTPKPDDSVRGVPAQEQADPAAESSAGSADAELVITEDSEVPAAPAAEDPDAYAQPVACTVSGSFTATVRKLIPDYVSDLDTPRAAVVTLFQDGPFVLTLDEQLCARLQEDKTFTFIVGEQDAELRQWEYSNGGFVNETALKERHISVTDVREPTDDEYGMDGMRIECSPKS